MGKRKWQAQIEAVMFAMRTIIEKAIKGPGDPTEPPLADVFAPLEQIKNKIKWQEQKTRKAASIIGRLRNSMITTAFYAYTKGERKDTGTLSKVVDELFKSDSFNHLQLLRGEHTDDQLRCSFIDWMRHTTPGEQQEKSLQPDETLINKKPQDVRITKEIAEAILRHGAFKQKQKQPHQQESKSTDFANPESEHDEADETNQEELEPEQTDSEFEEGLEIELDNPDDNSSTKHQREETFPNQEEAEYGFGTGQDKEVRFQINIPSHNFTRDEPKRRRRSVNF